MDVKIVHLGGAGTYDLGLHGQTDSDSVASFPVTAITVSKAHILSSRRGL